MKRASLHGAGPDLHAARAAFNEALGKSGPAQRAAARRYGALLEEYLEGLRRNSAHASARESMRWARSEQAVVVAHARASMKKGGKK